jgi:hypothetical protein
MATWSASRVSVRSPLSLFVVAVLAPQNASDWFWSTLRGLYEPGELAAQKSESECEGAPGC